MRGVTLGIVAVCVGGFINTAAASDSDTERASLTGLGNVSVVVEELSAVATRSGLTVAAIQADTERRLRQAGITVTSDSDAYVYVHITVVDPGGAIPLPYLVDVSLMQEVTLPRGFKTRTPLQTATWWMNSLGMSGPDLLRASVNGRVGQFVDNFVRAFRSVNPAK